MSKLFAAASLVMLISTSVIADTAPRAMAKSIPEAQTPARNMSLLLVAGGIVVGGVTLAADNN